MVFCWYVDFASNPVVSWADGNGSENYQERLVASLLQRGVPVIDSRPGRRMTAPDVYRQAGDVWLVSRDVKAPQSVPRGKEKRYLLCHDVDYAGLQPASWDGLLVETDIHGRYLQSRYPGVKVITVGNGLPLADYELSEPPARDPFRVAYTSCPSRGLWNMLRVWMRVVELCPQANLHVYYGWGTLERTCTQGGQQAVHLQRTRAKCEKYLERLRDSVTWHGRVPRQELIQGLYASGVWAYPVGLFPEVCCQSSQEAQLCGAVPVVRPSWAVGETTRHGVAVPGDLNESLARCRFAYELTSLLYDPERQERIRVPMMADARESFSWDDCVERIIEVINV